MKGIFTRKQRQVIEMLAAGYTDTETAKRCGVSRTTIWRWREKIPGFKEAIVTAAKEAMHREVPAVIQELLKEAKMGKRSNKIQAIRMVLEMTGLYAERSEVKSSMEGTFAFEKLTDEELDAAIERLLKEKSGEVK